MQDESFFRGRQKSGRGKKFIFKMRGEREIRMGRKICIVSGHRFIKSSGGGGTGTGESVK